MNQHWLKLLEGKGKKGKKRRPRTPEHQASIDAKNALAARAAQAKAKFDSSVAGQSQTRLHQIGNTHIDVTHGAVSDAINRASKTWRGHPDHDKEVDRAAVNASTTLGGDRDLTVSQAKKQSYRRHRGSDPTAGATRVWAADKKPDQPRGTPRDTEEIEDSTMSNTPRLPRSSASDWEKVGERGRGIRVGWRHRETGELPSWEEIELQSKWDAGWDPNQRPARRIRRREEKKSGHVVIEPKNEERGDQYGANVAQPGTPGADVADKPPERGSSRARRWAKRLLRFRRSQRKLMKPRETNDWTTYKKIGQIISDGRTSGQDAGATGLRLSMVATAGGLRPRKLSQRDYEAGHTDPQKAAILRVGKKIARRKAKKASDERRAALDKNVSYGGHAMDDLHQGIKTSPRDGGGTQDPDKSPGTLKPITLGKIKRKPESATGSLSQSIKHGELVKKAGKKAATMARGEYAAGLERGGITFKPGSKTAILAKRSRTQKAAEGIRATLRTGKHAAAQATGSKTGKAPRTTTSTTRRRRVKAVSQARRGRAGTYGDPKKGYRDPEDDTDSLMDF